MNRQELIQFKLNPSLKECALHRAVLQSAWQENEAFLDKLNRAEKLGLLYSVDQWQRLRELPNQITHEYPGNHEAIIIGLVAQVPILLEMHEQIAKAAALRFSAEYEK